MRRRIQRAKFVETKRWNVCKRYAFFALTSVFNLFFTLLSYAICLRVAFYWLSYFFLISPFSHTYICFSCPPYRSLILHPLRICRRCNAMNFARRQECFRCYAPGGGGGGGGYDDRGRGGGYDDRGRGGGYDDRRGGYDDRRGGYVSLLHLPTSAVPCD